MALTDDDREAKLSSLADNNEVLLRDVYEQLADMPTTPSPEVFAASAIVMAAISTAIVIGTDESNMAMLARVTAAIQEPA